MTVAVMVLYNPDLDLLKRNLDAISPQVERVYVVDNTPGGNLSGWEGLGEGVVYIPIGKNLGIAAAQNIGIRRAIEEGAENIYFLDQDSISPPDIIRKLSHKKRELENKGVRIGAIGALPINREAGKPYIPTVVSSEGIEGITETGELISSGSLISVHALKIVGLMMEELFIDGVDHEWCWRAKEKWGYRFFVVNDAPLSHQLGRGDRRMLWWKVALPSPARTYYLYRNIFLLSRKPYVPLFFKLKNGLKLALKIFYYPLFISPRGEYAKNIFRGIRDGIRSLK